MFSNGGLQIKFGLPTLQVWPLVNFKIHLVKHPSREWCSCSPLGFFLWSIFCPSWPAKKYKAKQKKKYVSKLPHVFVFRCAFDSAKFNLLIFSPFLFFFSSKVYIKDMTGTIKHILNNKLLELCAPIYFSLVSSSTNNQVSYFTLDKSCDQLKLDNKTKQNKPKTNKNKNKKCMPHWFSKLSQALRHTIYLFKPY